MTTVGIIGSGLIGGTVARLSVAAGHQVVLSNSRGPETLEELAAELGPLARAATAEQAGEAGDLVVVSVPVKAFGDVPVKPLAGKPVLDTGNYYAERDGHIAELDTGAATSSELLQRYLPGSQVVKVFNNISFKHLRSLARPRGADDRSALPIAGDDAAAKPAVTAFLDSIGYDAVDAARSPTAGARSRARRPTGARTARSLTRWGRPPTPRRYAPTWSAPSGNRPSGNRPSGNLRRVTAAS
jgi:8-hydroxy-5-deazaflavin:NADPH oxidoreductase